MLSIKSLVTDTMDTRNGGAHYSISRDGNTTIADESEDATATAPVTQLPTPPATSPVHTESTRRYTPKLPRHNRVASAGLRITIPNDSDYYAYALCRPLPESKDPMAYMTPVGYGYTVFASTGQMLYLFIPGPKLPHQVSRYSVPPDGSIRPIVAPMDSVSPLSLPGPMLPHSGSHAGSMLPVGSTLCTRENTSFIPVSTISQGIVQGSALLMAMSNFPQAPFGASNVFIFAQYEAAPPAQRPSSSSQRQPNEHHTPLKQRAFETQRTALKRKFGFAEHIVPPSFMTNSDKNGRWDIDYYSRWYPLIASKNKRPRLR